jgi:hypothetical protein
MCLGRLIGLGLLLVAGSATGSGSASDAGSDSGSGVRAGSGAAAATGDGESDDTNNRKLRAANTLLKNEGIGGVHMGMTGKEVVAILGQPSKKYKIEQEGVRGEFTTRWWWKSQNIGVVFFGATSKSPATVRGITVVGPSQLKTSKGVGIGSPVQDVEAAYSDGHMQPEAKAAYVVGGEYGMVFDVSGGKVGAIYWGLDFGP